MPDKIITCPLICGKSLKTSALHKHLKECKKKDLLGIKFERCSFNYNHIIEISKMQEHLIKCPTKLENEEEIERKRAESEKENTKIKSEINENFSDEEVLTLDKAFANADKQRDLRFGNDGFHAGKKDITIKRKFNYKKSEISEMEEKLLNDHKEDTKQIFFDNIDEIDSDADNFYNLVYKGKSLHV